MVDVAGLFLLDIAEEGFASCVGIFGLESAMMRTLEGNAIMGYSLILCSVKIIQVLSLTYPSTHITRSFP